MLNKYSNKNVYVDQETFNTYFENPKEVKGINVWSGLSSCYLIVENETSAQNLSNDNNTLTTNLRVRGVVAKNISNVTYYTPVILTK